MIELEDILAYDELENHLAPLATDEIILLEESCVKNGIHEPIVVWPVEDKYIIVDGYHRFRISQKHGIQFKTRVKEFANIEQAKEWMERNQRGRRNISDFRKVELALGRSDSEQPTTRDLSARLGYSTGKISSAAYVLKNGTDEIKQLARRGDISVDQAYQRTRKAETPQDYSDQKKLINQIPYAFKADPRMLSIFLFFESNKDREDNPSHMKLAKEWRDIMGLTEDNLPTDTIVKSYIRLRDSIRKDKEKILKYL